MYITIIELPNTKSLKRNWFDKETFETWKKIATWFKNSEPKILFQHIGPKGIHIFSYEALDEYRLVSMAALELHRMLTGECKQELDDPAYYLKIILSRSAEYSKEAYWEKQGIDVETHQLTFEEILSTTMAMQIPTEFITGVLIVDDKAFTETEDMFSCLKSF